MARDTSNPSDDSEHDKPNSSDDSEHDTSEDRRRRTDENADPHAPPLGPLESASGRASTARRERDFHPVDTPITVCYVDDDPTFRDRVRSVFANDDRLEIRTESSLRAAMGHLDSIDCLVRGDATPAGTGDEAREDRENEDVAIDEGEDTDGREADGEDEHGTETELETLEAVRERDPTLPVVYFSDEVGEAVFARLRSTSWVDCLRKGDDDVTVASLGYRIRNLVDCRRQSTLTQRALVALETVQSGVAIVASDGTFETVDRVFAATFGAGPDDLLGRPWHTIYPDEEADRLRTTALPTAEDGWRWTGRCVGERTDGTTFTARTDIVGLEDGGLVFVLGESADSTVADGSS